ncbi:MAG: type II toxin-antitoxin system PemK/MazF family toxin [Candidatus Hydrogenedentes bacterium]|nr:type II toxin-antitoxin system PemK/MazF family toxin [Candidatus Hydrogenedentota bacterium]
MDVVVRRFDVYLVSLDPTRGHEIKKTRPCLVISPDEMNRNLLTAIVAPMTTQSRACPSRVHCRFQGKDGYIVLDQLRTVDKARLVKRLGRIAPAAQKDVLLVLADMFAE